MVRVLKFGTHLLVVMAAFLLAYQMRRALDLNWWLTNDDAHRVLGWAALYALIAGAIELVSQTERGAWRFASAREAVVLLRNTIVTALVFVLLIFILDRGVDLPRSVLPLAWGLSFAFLVGLRLSWRLVYDRNLAANILPSWWRAKAPHGKALVIVGPLAAAERHVRHLRSDADRGYWPEVVLTPNLQEQGLKLHDVPCVAGYANLEKVLAMRGKESQRPPSILFLAEPVAEMGFTAERIGRLRAAGHALLRPQSLIGLNETDGGGSNRLREISLEEFLPREPVRLDPGPITALIENRRVMVTGAGGSIGSELARQLTALRCAHLSLVDHSEFLLFEINRELAERHPSASRRALLANVRDEDRIVEIMHQERPDIVFHAAALKHVALVEGNPAEGVLTNVLGTSNVMTTAIQAGAAQFVLISTDKAVAPSNTMGATKRIAETLLDLTPSGTTRLSAVRFGNVLGSAGSVVPIFRDQIARGGPVTVTHPDVDRYFMTIPEAVQLVLHSSAIKASQSGRAPSKFLLEMGQPVKIADLARQMIELSGKVPDIDIEIEFTGLKPGEKLSEILFDEGESVTECIPGIMEIRTDGAPELTEAGVRELIAVARRRDEPRTREAIASAVDAIRGVDARQSRKARPMRIVPDSRASRS